MIKGIHHISMRCNDPEEFEKVRDFYLNVLGLTVKREWPGAVMIDTGGDSVLEINTGGENPRQAGVVRHFALAVDDVDTLVERVKAAGYTVTREHTDIALPSDPPLPARIAFCVGAIGEEIEFFCEK